jgi:hypothetical protein
MLLPLTLDNRCLAAWLPAYLATNSCLHTCPALPLRLPSPLQALTYEDIEAVDPDFYRTLK